MGRSGSYDIAQNDLARLFLFADKTTKCVEPWAFMSCVAMDGLSQDRDVTKYECPSDTQLGEFVEVAVIAGELSRLTTTLTGRMSRKERSMFYNLFSQGCPVDLHLHMGLCQRPDSFTEYDKAIIFEDVYITSYGSDPLIALQSGDRNVINETIDISIGTMYEVVPLTYTERGAGVVDANGAIVDALFVDVPQCGTCGTKSDGCQRAVAVSDDGHVYITEDGGVNWAEVTLPVNSLGGNLTAPIAAISYQGDLLVAESDGDIWRANLADLFDNIVTVWDTASFTGMATLDIEQYGNSIVVGVGTNGDIQYFAQFGETASVASNGTLTTADITRVQCGPGKTFVAGSATGEVFYSDDGIIWQETAVQPSAGSVTAIMVKDSSSYVVGYSTGELHCTSNKGLTWTQIRYPGFASNLGAINDLALATDHVAYLVQGTRVLRSIDGGVNWSVQPDSRQTMPAVTVFNRVAGCGYDANRVLAVGEGTTAGTGTIVLGVE